MTRDELEKLVRSSVGVSLASLAGRHPTRAELASALSRNLSALLGPDDVRVEVIDETEKERVVREVMEEPEALAFRIMATRPVYQDQICVRVVSEKEEKNE